MNIPAKIISLLLLLPTLSKCDCTVERGEIRVIQKPHDWDTNMRYGTFPESVMGVIISCKTVSLDGRNPVKSIIKSADAEVARKAELISIVNSTVPVVESAIFDSFRSISKVVLDNDGIVDIQSNSFADMVNLTEINIVNNKLTRISKEALSGINLKVLNLFNNKINTLVGINEIAPLEVLNISYNLIKTVNNNDFQNLQSLQTIDLSGNEITEIDSGIFEMLPKLKDLYLRNNSLSTYYIVPFVQPISNLDLSSNTIENIRINNKQSFMLYNLDFSNNHIMEIEVGQFKNLPKLANLNLSDCFIQTIDVDAFDYLDNLTTLSLSENFISSIFVGTFHQLPALEVLNLSWNNIESLENGIFTGLRSLEVLDLSNNRLQTIDSNIFYPIKGVQEIYLHGNLLENYDVTNLASYFRSLRHISINFKQIGCESLVYMMRRMRSNSVEVKHGHHFKGHNVHGIACDPDLQDTILLRHEQFEEELFSIFNYFPIVKIILIVLVVFSIIFLIIKTLLIYNIDYNYCRRRLFKRESPSRSSTRFSENDHA